MRVSIINLNLVSTDAVGRSILNQVRFFRRRGDAVQIYSMHPPQGVPEDVAALTHVMSLGHLMARLDAHFASSDVYVFHYPGRYPLLELIRGIERGAVIMFFHNVTPPKLLGSTEEREHLQHSIDSIGPLSFYADLIVTPSEFNADQLVQAHGCEADRVRVLPLAVEIEKFTPGPKDKVLLQKHGLEGRKVILYVGRMAGNKRVDLLVEALAHVRQQIPETELLLVGDHDSNQGFKDGVARIRARAAELGCGEAIHFTGVVDDVAAYFRLADVYASASLHEGFGVPLIEAMAVGVPVVASRATAHPWVLGDAGVLTEPGNSLEMAEQIVRVLVDDGLCGKLVESGLQRARDFSLDCFEEGWAKIVAEATIGRIPPQGIRARSLLGATMASASQATGRNPRQATNLEALMAFRESVWREAVSAELVRLERASDVMIRGYVVSSRLPLLGKVIAWLRRHLTSHLREPYVDPILERQVVFNREVVYLLRRIIESAPSAAGETAGAGQDLQLHDGQTRVSADLSNPPKEQGMRGSK